MDTPREDGSQDYRERLIESEKRSGTYRDEARSYRDECNRLKEEMMQLALLGSEAQAKFELEHKKRRTAEKRAREAEEMVVDLRQNVSDARTSYLEAEERIARITREKDEAMVRVHNETRRIIARLEKQLELSRAEIGAQEASLVALRDMLQDERYTVAGLVSMSRRK